MQTFVFFNHSNKEKMMKDKEGRKEEEKERELVWSNCTMNNVVVHYIIAGRSLYKHDTCLVCARDESGDGRIIFNMWHVCVRGLIQFAISLKTK